MKTLYKQELVMVIVFILVFIFIRSIHFSEHLNFSADQGIFSIKALNIYQNHTLTLIGPPASFNLDGRQIFQGSIIYYFQLFFLILGNFDPVKSSYFFMLFSATMIIPLYFGIKFLINKNSAILTLIIYSLLPFYIDYTRFLWNPNYQFSLTPLLILFMGLYKHTKRTRYLFFLSSIAGFLTMFHYQFIFILIGLMFFYIYFSKHKLYVILIMLSGLFLGLSPLIIFELRNNFYNTQTIVLFINNMQNLVSSNSSFYKTPHYFLTISLFFIILSIYVLKNKINSKLLIGVFLTLIFWSFVTYLPKPDHAFGNVTKWNYLNEEKIYNIISHNAITNYNIVNLSYDTLASVQKYLHLKNGKMINLNDYTTNEYLYVITDKEDFMNDPAYEVNTFKPSIIINMWNINNFYNLYLLRRDNKT